MWIFKPGILISAFSVLILTASSDPYAPIIAPQDSHHWRKLEKVCEEGRKTYGANEFVENGRVCRWTMVPYWPKDKGTEK